MLKVILFIFLGLFALDARSEFKVPALTGPVVDEANVLQYRDEERMAQMIRTLYYDGVAQLTVVTLPSLQGLTIEQAGIQIADTWKLGTKNQDNGLILILAPQERKLRIEVGQGLEGTIPDVIAKRVIEDRIIPMVRAQGISAGALAGVQALQNVLMPSENSTQEVESSPATESSARGRDFVISIFFLLIFITVAFLARITGSRGRRLRSRNSDWYVGTGGGGWSGRSGGGGWSGGGGGFSGGGASGGW